MPSTYRWYEFYFIFLFFSPLSSTYIVYNFCRLQNDILYRRNVSQVNDEARTWFLSSVDLSSHSFVPTTRLCSICTHAWGWKQINGVSLQAVMSRPVVPWKISRNSIYIILYALFNADIRYSKTRVTNSECLTQKHANTTKNWFRIVCSPPVSIVTPERMFSYTVCQRQCKKIYFIVINLHTAIGFRSD